MKAHIFSENKVKTSLKIILLIIGICFFFPLCTVSCSQSGEEDARDVSLKDAAFGVVVWDDNESETVEGEIICLTLLVVPVALLIFISVAKKMYSLVTGAVVAAGGLLDTIILLQLEKILRNGIAGDEADSFTQMAMSSIVIEFNLVYYIEIILNVIVLVIGILCIINRDVEATPSVGEKPMLTKPTLKSKAPVASIGMVCCEKCGSPLEEDSLFCTNCGAKLDDKLAKETRETVEEITDEHVKEDLRLSAKAPEDNERETIRTVGNEDKKGETGAKLKSTMRTTSTEGDIGFTKAGDL